MVRRPILDADQTAQLVTWTLQGRSNSYKRAIRQDAENSLESSACAESASIAWHKLFADPERMPVVRCDPSPMNRKRKMLTLACGHEVWTGIKTRTARCPACCAARGAKP